ncbi:MAG: HAD-IA family hydrolase [Lachnospiraceae bacterium]|nr:HAD-IA family hydrolase [Lachnospiraceae bacterium]
MGRYKTVIFDLDGTLLDTLEDLTDAVNYALEAYKMPLRTIEEVRNFVGNGVRKLMLQAVPDGEKNPSFEEIFSLFKEYYGEHCNDKTGPYKGILELMEELRKQGYVMGIVSNKIDSAVKELNSMYFADYIQVAIGEKEGVQRKPAPDTVFAALQELDMEKETAIYIGDSEVDLATARNAGIPCISVLWGFREREFLEECGADMFAETPKDVSDFLFCK